MALKPIQILINAKDNASSVFASLQSKVAAVGVAIAGYFGISAFAGAVRGAADMESAMSRVQAATGAGADEMRELRKAADEAAVNTKFTGVEAAGALENLAKAGLSAQESIGALPAVMNLAQAGDIGLGEASEYVTKAVMGMGLAFSDAGRVADVLALGANATNTSVTGLAQALSYAAPVAQSMGLSLESTVAMMGKLADGGIDASRSGTALANVLAQFSDPASNFRRELGAAGITTTNFEKALHQLADAGPRGEKAILAVGLNAGPALRSLLNQGMPALDELTQKLHGAEGSAAAAAKVMQDNLNGSLQGLSSAWGALKDKLATPVLPVLREGVDQLAAAFKNAVADGTVQRFGESIATAFKTGIQFVRDFISTVDFNAVLARMQEFANNANETFTKVGEYATNAGNTVKLAYGIMSAGVNGVLTAIYGIGSVFAEVAEGVMKGVALLRERLAKITFGNLSESFKLAAEDARSMAQGFGDAAQAMRDKASQSFQDMADRAQTARNGFEGLVASQGVASKATAEWAAIVAAARAETEASADAAVKAGIAYQKKSNAEQLATQAAQTHKDAIAKLRAEYDALISTGSLTEAAQKLQEINDKLRQTPAATTEAKEKLEAAFKNLGMTASADLEEAASRTSAAWDTMTAQGVRSASVLREAFAAYANATLAAAERQGDAAVATAQRMLATKAAAAGLTLEVDRSGQVIVKSMRDAKKATDDVRDSAKGAAGGYREMGAAAAESAQKLKALYDRHRLNADQSQADIDASRKNVSGNAAILQTDINQQIAERYGEEFIGNALAEQAFQRRLELDNYRKNYGNVARSQQSLNEQRNIAAELERLERAIEAERQSAQGGTTAAPAVPARGDEAAPSRRRGGVSSGMSVGSTVVNITLDGYTRTINTDSPGAQMIRELMEAKARSR